VDVIYLDPSSRPCLSKSVKHYLFLNLNLFYLLSVCVEGYCCTWSHTVTHTS